MALQASFLYAHRIQQPLKHLMMRGVPITWLKTNTRRRNKAETIKTFKLLPTGIIIATEYGRKLKFMRAYNKSWSQIVCLDIEENKVYRYSYKSFKADELKQALEELKAA